MALPYVVRRQPLTKTDQDQPSQRERFIPFLHDAFYILDLLYVGFNYSYVLVYGSSSSNSLSLFFCLAQYNPQYFWYTFIP